MKSLTKDQNDIFLPLFSRCLLTDQEYYALLALVMSELGENTLLALERTVIQTQMMCRKRHT